MVVVKVVLVAVVAAIHLQVEVEVDTVVAVVVVGVIMVLIIVAVAVAVVNGIGPRPAQEDWVVWIHDPQHRPGYLITIEGAHGFLWKRRFVGPGERAPEFIRGAVFRATH